MRGGASSAFRFPPRPFVTNSLPISPKKFSVYFFVCLRDDAISQDSGVRGFVRVKGVGINLWVNDLLRVGVKGLIVLSVTRCKSSQSSESL